MKAADAAVELFARVVVLAGVTVAGAAGILAQSPVPRPPAATLEELLSRVSAYVHVFVDRFSNVVATEQYVQERVRGIRGGKHALTSDYLLITLPGSADWIECRDVYEADGKQVGDRQTRLLKLLRDGSPNDWSARASAVARESTRYNLDDIGTLNRPLVTLALMQAPYRARLEVTEGKADPATGPGIGIIAFREIGAARMFEKSPVWGRVWVNTSSGVILKTELSFGNPRTPSQVVTTFKEDPSLGVAVPIEMTELYHLGGLSGDITGNATYGAFRRFGVTSTEHFDE